MSTGTRHYSEPFTDGANMKELNSAIEMLIKEMDNVERGDLPSASVTEQAQRVMDLLPVCPDGTSLPLHKLVSSGPYKKTELPLEAVIKLIESGFDVNAFDNDGNTCQYIAIYQKHYDAVRCLVKHGANCNAGSRGYNTHDFEEEQRESTIVTLTFNPCAPLDLFNVLATPLTLNEAPYRRYPLHVAVSRGFTHIALHLIYLGADVNVVNMYDGLPIQQYEDSYKKYNDVLFTHLIPTNTMDKLACIGRLFARSDDMDYYDDENEQHNCDGIDDHMEHDDTKQYGEDMSYEDLHKLHKARVLTRDTNPYKHRCRMLHRLLQNITPCGNMSISIRSNEWNEWSFYINDQEHLVETFRPLYWWSLLLTDLGWKFATTPELITPLLDSSTHEQDHQLACFIDDLWITYRVTTVPVLMQLCVQQCRRSMKDLSAESFSSLSVQSSICKLLMNHAVAASVCKAMRNMQIE